MEEVQFIDTNTGLYPEYIARGVYKIKIAFDDLRRKHKKYIEEYDRAGKLHGVHVFFNEYATATCVMHYRHGKLHCEKGPALTIDNSFQYQAEYYLNGAQVTKADLETLQISAMRDLLPLPIFEEVCENYTVC